MGKKVNLLFEEGKYKIYINDTLIEESNDVDISFEKFKQVINNNLMEKSLSWDFIEERLKLFNHKDCKVDSTYKTISLGEIKYFYSTGKLFYIAHKEMIELIGGIDLFLFVVNLIKEGSIDDYNELLKLLKIVLKTKANYRVSESTIFISSPKFNYGTVEYNFNTKRINKGTNLSSCTFKEFKSYVLNILQ